jgi:lysophospholipase L1-like esterase
MKLPFLLLLCWLAGFGLSAQPVIEPYLQKEIDAFIAADQAKAPQKGQIVLYGSSSLRLWQTAGTDLAMPGLTVINRGFGGSQAYQANYFFEQVVVPLQPRYLIYYEGDNDLNAGKSVDEVYRDIAITVEKVRKQLPETQLIILGVKHSGSRLPQMDAQRNLNRKVRKLCRKTRRTTWVDTASMLLDASGKPDPKYFMADLLHLNAAGYAGWTKAVRKALED